MTHYQSPKTDTRKIYKDTLAVDFNGHVFNAPAGYDEFLRSQYGNYMTLPPLDKRQTHEIEVFRTQIVQPKVLLDF